MKRKNLFEAGMSLTEAMIAVGLLGIVTSGAFQYASSFLKNQNMAKNLLTRDTIAANVSKQISDPKNILLSGSSAYRASSPGNQTLYNCMNGSLCTSTNTDNRVPFNLFGPLYGGKVEGRLAGTATNPVNPVNYDRTGRICLPSDTKCKAAWEATAYFTVICPNEAASCTDMVAVRVWYQIRNKPIDTKVDVRALPHFPSDNDFNNFKLHTSIVVQLVGSGGDNSTTNVCPPFTQAYSRTIAGRFICRCITGATKTGTDVDGNDICSFRIFCGPNQKMTGIRADGSIICSDLMPCRDRVLPYNGVCQGFLKRINLGRCYIDPNTVGKKTNVYKENKINCPTATMTCCVPT
ncbi:MAG: hypothetical protein HQK54_11550 [Oligoflexales bacterium]|nr:hypothetical protein [Oligoflexales bacterium]